MYSNRRALLSLLLAPALLSACVTKGRFNREIAAVRGEIATERTERTSADDALRADITSLRGELQTMRTEFGAKITAMEEGLKFALPVNFAYDDASVREQDQAALQRFAQIAQKYYPGSQITVEGFADPAGSARYNLALSQRRAESVRAFLESNGMSGAPLKAVGYGETRQVAPGAERDEPGAEQNRRVVFVIETNGEAARMTAAAID